MRLGQPAAGKVVIAGEAVELVPRVVDRIDLAALGPVKRLRELLVAGTARFMIRMLGTVPASVTGALV